ncbi:hypothetical protein GOV08_01270 [Candidatus Woesearchaeota archaeon]|nr:hypothetical protein [Candidatus Woesearchaeota archaeon]
MSSKRGLKVENRDKDSSMPPLTKEEVSVLKNVNKILKKHSLSYEELKNLLEEELSFPISILNQKLTTLESLVKYLKEEKEFSFSKTAEILSRDQRNIWHIYDSAKKKLFQKFQVKDEKIWIPIRIISDGKLSAQEAVVWFLKEEIGFSFAKIAKLLERDQRTIWTVYQRARGKNAKK